MIHIITRVPRKRSRIFLSILRISLGPAIHPYALSPYLIYFVKALFPFSETTTTTTTTTTIYESRLHFLFMQIYITPDLFKEKG